MASIGLGGGNVVATTAKLVGRHSARQSRRLIIDFTTVAPRLMKLPLSAWKASTSPPSLESSGHLEHSSSLAGKGNRMVPAVQ